MESQASGQHIVSQVCFKASRLESNLFSNQPQKSWVLKIIVETYWRGGNEGCSHVAWVSTGTESHDVPNCESVYTQVWYTYSYW